VDDPVKEARGVAFMTVGVAAEVAAEGKTGPEIAVNELSTGTGGICFLSFGAEGGKGAYGARKVDVVDGADTKDRADAAGCGISRGCTERTGWSRYA
jgi:hypothetical protein